MRFLFLLAQLHENFRQQELIAVAEMLQISLDLSKYVCNSPYLELELENEEQAIALTQRCFLVKSCYKIYSQGTSMDEIHAQNKANLSQFQDLMGKSFKVEFSSYQGNRTKEQQLKEINALSYTELDGPICMKNPEVRLVFLESYVVRDPVAKYIWFTKFLANSNREAIEVYDLKKRPHVGTTSFDAELAFVTTNMIQARKGDVIYDPFSGTGSFPIAAAYHKSYVFASDIDRRPLKNYHRNFQHYNTESHLIDALEMDFTHNAFRPGFKFDGIICDPPYGVRERIVVCGAAKPERFIDHEKRVYNNEISHLRRDYIPTKKPYDLSLMINDLFEFASQKLHHGRRLAFWLPLDDEDVPTTKIPLHPDLEFKAISIQRFAKWQRWLLTYQRRPEGERGPSEPINLSDDFREKYYTRYTKE